MWNLCAYLITLNTLGLVELVVIFLVPLLCVGVHVPDASVPLFNWEWVLFIAEHHEVQVIIQDSGGVLDVEKQFVLGEPRFHFVVEPMIIWLFHFVNHDQAFTHHPVLEAAFNILHLHVTGIVESNELGGDITDATFACAPYTTDQCAVGQSSFWAKDHMAHNI